MALATAQLKTDLKALYASARVGEGISDDDFADSMASLFTSFVQSGTVTTNQIGVQATGSPFPPGTGVVA